jgi:hypothetical protein
MRKSSGRTDALHVEQENNIHSHVVKMMLLNFPRPSAFKNDINVWRSFSWLKNSTQSCKKQFLQTSLYKTSFLTGEVMTKDMPEKGVHEIETLLIEVSRAETLLKEGVTYERGSHDQRRFLQKKSTVNTLLTEGVGVTNLQHWAGRRRAAAHRRGATHPLPGSVRRSPGSAHACARNATPRTTPDTR